MEYSEDSTQSDQFDIQGWEELMELVFAYTAAAHNFGFTHKMNNRFTALSMNASFLKQALAQHDYDKAAAKAVQVSDSINNLVKFSQDLMSTDLIPTENQQIEFPTMITAILGKLLMLPTFNGVELEQNLSTEVLQTTANPGIVWIFLYTFLKHARRYSIKGPLLLSTTFNQQQNQYIIKTDVDQILQSPSLEPEDAALAFPSLGEMPVRYLARVIRNVSSQFELIHRADRPLTLELRINL
ncbi:MAG: hypothetical protein K9N29_08980 [Candidatus Marinimicrobia bacterium]|nr:hypothetical protein [Candidatus Neomarinimicrobiota bacterium]